VLNLQDTHLIASFIFDTQACSMSTEVVIHFHTFQGLVVRLLQKGKLMASPWSPLSLRSSSSKSWAQLLDFLE